MSKEVRGASGAVGRRPQVSELNGHYWLRCVDESAISAWQCSDFNLKRNLKNEKRSTVDQRFSRQSKESAAKMKAADVR